MGLFDSIGDALSGGWGDLAGGLLGFAGGERANSANMASAREVMQFNKEQAELDRAFQSKELDEQRLFGATESLKARRMGARESHVNRQFQAYQALAARRYEARMANTAMQRQAKDLRAAGLNPILALTRGGAATPNAPVGSGSAAHGTAATSGSAGGRAAQGVMAHMEDSLSRGLNSGLRTYQLKQEMKRVQEDTENVVAGRDVIKEDARVKRAQVEEIKARVEQTKTDTALKVLQQGLVQSQTGRIVDERKHIMQQIDDLKSQIEKRGMAYQHEKEQLRQLELEYPRKAIDADIFSGAFGRAIRYADLTRPMVSSARELAGAGAGLFALPKVLRGLKGITPRLRNWR